jgi:hypothetical protein
MYVFGAGLVVMKNEMEATRELWISYARAWKALASAELRNGVKGVSFG